MDIKEFLIEVENKQNHPWELSRFNIIYHLIKPFLPKKETHILDIGCGDSFFIEKLSHKITSSQCYAIDTAFTDDMMNYFRKKYAENKISFYKNIEDLNFQNIQADLILLLDVMEHIENDQAFLDHIFQQEFIQKGSLIAISVPALESLYCNRDKWLGHYRRYTLNMLVQLFKTKNVEILRLEYFYKTLIIPRFISKKLEKKNETEQAGIGSWNKGRLMTSIYQFILDMDYAIFNKFLHLKKMKGLSAFILVKVK